MPRRTENTAIMVTERRPERSGFNLILELVDEEDVPYRRRGLTIKRAGKAAAAYDSRVVPDNPYISLRQSSDTRF